MSREDQVRTLLRFHSQVVDPLRTVGGGDGWGPAMPHEYRAYPVWKELERCMRLMRKDHRTLWWHTYERYYAARVKKQRVLFRHGRAILRPFEQLQGEKPSDKRLGKNRVHDEPRLVESWSPLVNQGIADGGVAWLSTEMFQGGVLFLPPEIVEAAA